MEVAGFSTGVILAAVEVDGKRALLTRAPLERSFRAAPVGFLRSAPVGYLCSAQVGYSTGRLVASYRRFDCVAPRHRLFPASTSPRFPTSAPLGSYTDRIRAAPHPPACTAETSNLPADSTPENVPPKGPTPFWDQILSFLQGNVFKLTLLAVSLFGGYAAAMKGNKLAGDAVEICDKTHKYITFSPRPSR